jgi:hypothetical protein
MWHGFDCILVSSHYVGKVPPSNKRMEIVKSGMGMTRRLIEEPLWDTPKEEWLDQWEFTFRRPE